MPLKLIINCFPVILEVVFKTLKEERHCLLLLSRYKISHYLSIIVLNCERHIKSVAKALI